MKKLWMFLSMSAILFVFMSANVWAESCLEQEAVNWHLHKFSRGVMNITTAPLEIPKQMIKRAKKGKGFADQMAGYVTGTFTGIGWGAWRFTSGVVDIFTTPFCGNQKGLINPEFITDAEPECACE